MRSPIETKVALPALVMGPVIIIGPALYALARAYGILEPTPEQNTALIGVGVALQYVMHVYLGYTAPHTERLDLAPEEIDYAIAGPDDETGSRRVTRPPHERHRQ